MAGPWRYREALRLAPAISILAALALAGCIDEGTLQAAEAPPLRTGAVDLAAYDPVRGDLHGCTLAGAVTQIPLSDVTAGDIFDVPQPFQPADTTEYTGRTVPDTGQFHGIAHLALDCNAWQMNGDPGEAPTGGIVGLVIHPPPFAGIEPVERNYLVHSIATLDPTLAEAVTTIGHHVHPGEAQLITVQRPEGAAVQAELRTDGDGTYASRLLLENQGPAWPQLRFWLIVEGADGLLHPAALDLMTEGGNLLLGGGEFSHTDTDMHGPAQRTDLPSGGMGLTDFNGELRLTVLDATVDARWHH